MDNQQSSLTTKFGQYRFLHTNDGQETIYSEAFNEAAHSLSGANDETDHNYIQGCGLLKKLAISPTLTVFEVGFGAGIGLKRSLFHCERWTRGRKINFTSCEIDSELALYFLKQIAPGNINLNQENKSISLKLNLKNTYHIKILTGDIRLNHQEIPFGIDCLFQDAYSVKRNPSLWTQQWFKMLFERTNKHGTLATYSTSASVQKTLLSSGWQIYLRPGFGTKRSCLVANKIGKTSESIIHKLKSEQIKVLLDEQPISQK